MNYETFKAMAILLLREIADLLEASQAPPPTPEPEPDPLPEPEPPAPESFSAVIYLSDLEPAELPINGWGPYERDRANGEQGAGDGGPIMLRGLGYEKGLGVHARSVLSYDLGGYASRFRAIVGIDDSVGSTAASVAFRVLVDGVERFNAGPLGRASDPVVVDLDVAGVQRLTLEVDPLGSPNSDHADWADAHLTFDSEAMFSQFMLMHASGSGSTPPPPAGSTIGTVSVAGGGQHADGATVTFTASRSGNADDVVWSWAVPAGSSVVDSGTNVLTFTMGGR